MIVTQFAPRQGPGSGGGVFPRQGDLQRQKARKLFSFFGLAKGMQDCIAVDTSTLDADDLESVVVFSPVLRATPFPRISADPDVCDAICAEVIPWLSVLLGMM